MTFPGPLSGYLLELSVPVSLSYCCINQPPGTSGVRQYAFTIARESVAQLGGSSGPGRARLIWPGTPSEGRSGGGWLC